MAFCYSAPHHQHQLQQQLWTFFPFSSFNNKIPTYFCSSSLSFSTPITSYSSPSNSCCFCLSTSQKEIPTVVTTDQQQNDSTLDDICKPYVPHHILRRIIIKNGEIMEHVLLPVYKLDEPLGWWAALISLDRRLDVYNEGGGPAFCCGLNSTINLLTLYKQAEEVGYRTPTEIQRQALPVLFSGRDCILHAQTGSGKTLAYLLLIFSVINIQRSAVQALIVVPTRELGMQVANWAGGMGCATGDNGFGSQVAKVARMLAAKSDEPVPEDKSCTIMTLLDGGTLRRQKSWLKAEPPTIVVATLGSLCQMLEKQMVKLESMKVLVIDEVDFMFNSSHQVSSLRKLLISYTSIHNRQTIFASASIPQHRRFLYDCIQQKWTKADVVHIHANPVQPMPPRIHHRFLICSRSERHLALLSLLRSDAPQSAIIFANEQSEKSKKVGNAPATTVVIDALKNSHVGSHEILLLEEKLNFNSRAASFFELRQGGAYLLVATDIAGRGVDLPDTTHIYNFDLPKDAVHYLHRAGRTGRKPFSESKCVVTTIITPEERFVLQRYENELMFRCNELVL